MLPEKMIHAGRWVLPVSLETRRKVAVVGGRLVVTTRRQPHGDSDRPSEGCGRARKSARGSINRPQRRRGRSRGFYEWR